MSTDTPSSRKRARDQLDEDGVGSDDDNDDLVLPDAKPRGRRAALQDDASSDASSDAGASRPSARAADADSEAEEAPADEDEPSGDDEPDDFDDLDDLDDDDDEDDDDDDEQDHVAALNRPRKKTRVARFIDDVADVAEEDEEEEALLAAEEAGLGAIDDIEDEVDADDETYAERRRAFQELDDDEGNEEEQVRMLEERERLRRQQEKSGAVQKERLLPTVQDPSMWMVKCKSGKERLICASLMNKYFQRLAAGQPLHIVSVLCLDHMRGFFYVEAYREPHVRKALENMQFVYRTKMRMVPRDQMPGVLKSQPRGADLKPGDWVRMRRDVYKGDLAKVVRVLEGGSRIVVRVVPRIDYADLARQADEDTMNIDVIKGKKRAKSAKSARAPQRLFNPEALRAANASVSETKDSLANTWYIWENQRFLDGFLEKEVSVKTVQTKDVVPEVAELQLFEGASDALDEVPTVRDVRKQVHYDVGDRVIVISGELRNLTGVVHSVQGDMIQMVPQHEGLDDTPLQFQTADLRKHFVVGDHVKIIQGDSEGETGMVLRVEDDLIVVFSDSNMHEIRVFAQDAQMAPDIMPGADTLGKYSLHDMIMLDPQTVGVIVRVERKGFKVLDQEGRLHSLEMHQMGRKKSSRRVTSRDKDDNPIRVKDNVIVIDGPHRNRKGVIKQMFRSFSFLHCRDLIENGGIIVVRNRKVKKVGGQLAAKQSTALSLAMMSPGAALKTPARGDMMSTSSASSTANSINDDLRELYARPNQRDDLLHKKVIIKSGPYKGLTAYVRKTTGRNADVEIEAKNKVVTIDKKRLQRVGALGSGRAMEADLVAPRGSQTPMYGEGGRTPMRGDETPLHLGSATPLHTGVGSETPSHNPWNANAPQTPARGNEWAEDSGMSAGVWGGGATPSSAFMDGSATPNVGGSAFGNTPGADSTGTTPSSMTPSAYTPGGSSVFSGNTPLYSSGTPFTPFGMGNTGTPMGMAQTPGIGVQTPGIASTPMNVNTPAVGATPNTPMANTPMVNTPAYGSTPMVNTPMVNTPMVNTPMVNTPMVNTPMVNTPMPSTPAPGAGDPMATDTTSTTTTSTTSAAQEGPSGWVSVGMAVRIKESEENDVASAFIGEEGVVRQYDQASATWKVYLQSKDEFVNVTSDALSAVAPKKGDTVRVIEGEHAGMVGDLLAELAEGAEAIVKSGSDIQIVSVSMIAKIFKDFL